eukprot:GDKJ01049743.1.p1 GENE.GDKJ01049743.1~~GDKJ01049743.1.p1  ORF type:complete len:239 (-),score=50.10 GDKJ01049743.1:141-857(-)
MQAASMIQTRRNHASASLGGRLFACGGFDGSSILSSCESFDTRMKNWMEVPPLNTPRSASACTASKDGNFLFLLGGTKGERMRSVEIFDVRANKWFQEAVPGMIEVRSAASAALCGSNGRLFALGGTDASQNVHASVEMLDLGRNFGSNLSNGGASGVCTSSLWTFVRSMSCQRMDASACAVGSGFAEVNKEAILVSGGQCGEVLETTEFYRPETDEWQLGPNLRRGRYGHQMVVVTL